MNEINTIRIVNLENTKSLLKMFDKLKDKMDVEALNDYGKRVVKLLEDLDLYDEIGEWGSGLAFLHVVEAKEDEENDRQRKVLPTS